MLERPDGIHVVYAVDDGFARICGVSIASLLSNSLDAAGMDISILCDELSEENQGRLREVCHSFGKPGPYFVHIRALRELLGERVNTDRGSIMQYARLFVGRLPYDRIIYLDCDVMLRKSVRKLWETDLHGKTAAAVPDIYSRYYRRGMELEPFEAIYNNGVMVMDLDRWRSRNLEDRAIAYIHRHFGCPIKDDLGTVNAVLRGDITPLAPEWNAITSFYDFTYQEMLTYRKPPSYFPEELIERAAADPSLVHFASSYRSCRPWEEGCAHPFAEEWLRYQDKTPWSGAPARKAKKNMACRTLNALPDKLSVGIAMCFQVYLRPLWGQIKERVHKIGKNISACVRCHTRI